MSIGQLLGNRQRVRYNRALSEAFRITFATMEPQKGSAFSMKVLGHLRNFCYADASTVRLARDGAVDVQASAVAQGRREVWLEIAYYLNLTDATLSDLDRKFQREIQMLMERSLD